MINININIKVLWFSQALLVVKYRIFDSSFSSGLTTKALRGGGEGGGMGLELV